MMTTKQAMDRDNRISILNSTAAEVLQKLAAELGYRVKIVIVKWRKRKVQ